MEENIRGFLKDRFESAVISEDNFRGDLSFRIRPDSLVDICQALFDDPDLDVKFLADITAVDWLDHTEQEHGRYEMVYNLISLSNNFRFFLKVRLDGEEPTVATLCDIWLGANWMEREVFDMFGVIFEGHPELTKILTDDDLEGHPLRKDFPLTWEEPQFNWNKDQPPEVIK
jgi:NADH-quinone oxidoreductase subunit C